MVDETHVQLQFHEVNYREIMQHYAKGAIGAVLIINGGACLAVLSQLTELVSLPELSHRSIAGALLIFAFNVFLGMVMWLLGFESTRRADLAQRNRTDFDPAKHPRQFAVFLMIISSLLFMGSCLLLSWPLLANTS